MASVLDTELNSREHVLRSTFLRNGPDISNPWPVKRYDCTGQMFFISRHHTRNMCTINIRLFPLQNYVYWAKLIALGWSDTDKNPRFGIVRCDDYGNSMDDLQERVFREHHHT